MTARLHKRFFTLAFIMGFTFLGGTFTAVNAAEAPLSAQDSVDQYITDLFARVLEVKPFYESDRNRFFNEIGVQLSEFVDFKEVARGVMAKYGNGPNGATAEQLNRFSAAFKVNMIDFYGSALAGYGGEAFEFLASRRPPRDPENATSVRMNIASDDGSSIEVQYIMFLNEERIWKLKNLYIEGVNLRRQYYSRFDNLMTRNNYDIEKVIDLWLMDN